MVSVEVTFVCVLSACNLVDILINAVVSDEGPRYNLDPAMAFSASEVLKDDGDSSIWLAPDGQTSWFTIDLQQTAPVRLFKLRNTQNDQYKDRGTRKYMIETSLDKITWVRVAAGELQDDL